MKKNLFLLLCLAFNYCIAQNVGVGTASPTEKLDVNGNLNVNGQLKFNGNAGTTGQMLIKDASNNVIWADITEFKNFVIFDCANIANSNGTSNCGGSWPVPAGVTKIIVELWGGGGGGSGHGGGGGGYITARLNVIPGGSATLVIGAGGSYGSTGIDGVDGGTTQLTVNGQTVIATGGYGGDKNDPFLGGSAAQSLGGYFNVSGVTSNYWGVRGSPGGISRLSYTQVSSTEFAKVVHYGDGGSAGNLPNSGSQGGYRLFGITISQTLGGAQYPIAQGGGGSADASFGFYGNGGRIIIRWP